MSASSLSLSTIQTLTSTTVASTSAGLVAWSLPFDSIGIPVAVLFMALTGTAAGLLCTPPAATRLRMYGIAFAYTVFAAAAAIVLGEIPGLTFFAKVAPATALLIAFFAQTLVPVLREALAERAKRSIGGAK